MNVKSLFYQHVKETVELKREEKMAWKQLMKDQESSLINSNGQENLAATFEKQREEHNQFFTNEKANLIRKQQKDLDECKQSIEQKSSDKEIER